jgi:hypothetical protein
MVAEDLDEELDGSTDREVAAPWVAYEWSSLEELVVVFVLEAGHVKSTPKKSSK